MTKKKKKLKFKVRNWLLMFDTWFILIGFGLAISYGVWKIHEKNKQGPSEIIEKCLKENKSLLSDCLEVISSNSSEISLEDPDKNLRYVGSNPNNYLSLGDTYLTNVYRGFTSNGSSYKDYSSISTCLDDQEYGHKCIVVHKKGDPILWRIVGIFRIDDEPHVKLVRDESIGDYSWDSSRADVNMGYGVNEWSQADLRVLLNEGAYFQSKEGSCFNLEKNQSTSCDFRNWGIQNIVKEYIYEAPWLLGSINEDALNKGRGEEFYQLEQENHTKTCVTGEYCTDNVERTSLKKDYVGLLYPSDYIYASKNKECYQEPTKDKCQIDNWLYFKEQKSWFLTPLTYTYSNSYVTIYDQEKGISNSFASTYASVYPSIYLKHEVKIKDGMGSKENPFKVSL